MQESLEERIKNVMTELNKLFGKAVLFVEETTETPETVATAYLQSNGDYGYVVERDPEYTDIRVYFQGDPEYNSVIWERTPDNAVLFNKTLILIKQVKRTVGQ